MSLQSLLADDLIAWLAATPDGAPRRTLLWLDPEGQFRRLIGSLATELEARGVRWIAFDPAASVGQLALKLSLLKTEGEAGIRLVAYLPGFGRADLEPRTDGAPPTLWSVYEYRFKGCVWGRGERWEAGAVPEPMPLLAWLNRHGLRVAPGAENELSAGGADSLLARYVEQKSTVNPNDWPKPVRVDDVRAELAGDPHDALRRLLIDPAKALNKWGDERALVLERVDAEFGLGLIAEGKVAEATAGDAEKLADGAAIGIALADAWDALGRAPDFPFLRRLPPKNEQRERLTHLLRDEILPHAELRPRFRARLARLELRHDLRAWATFRPGQPAGLPLLARAHWDGFLARLTAARNDSSQAVRDLLAKERSAIDEAAAGPWSVGSDRPGDEPLPWRVAADLAALVADAQRAVTEVGSLARIADLVQAYAKRWWTIDEQYRRIRARGVGRGGSDVLRCAADAAYGAWVSHACDRLADLVEADPTWPPKGTAGAATLSKTLWSAPAGGRRGVIIADAVRWDLGEAIRAKLTETATITPILATLPTETPFGMAALLPLPATPPTVEFSSGWPTIKIGDGPDLAKRDGRKAFLKRALEGAGGKSLVEFVNLADLLRDRAVPAAPIVVVFDNTIDEQGHSNADALITELPHFVDGLVRAVGALHDGGIGTVHLVTDHGFLLLPTQFVDGLGHPPLLPAHVLRKDFRWAALKPDAAAQDVIRLPLPLAPNEVMLGLPRGVRTLIAAEPYLHGGLSLQECVIPHLVSQRTFARAKVGADLTVKNPFLTGGTVTVVIKPVQPAGQGTFGGVESTFVRLSIETEPGDGSPPRIVLPAFDVELRPDVDELRPAVYLPEGVDLKADQKLFLRAVDRDTGRDLGSILLTLTVDWD